MSASQFDVSHSGDIRATVAASQQVPHSAVLWLVSRLTGLTSTAAGDRAYTYDKVGNRKTLTDPSGTHTYTYDPLYQLKSADYPTGFAFADATFTYDPLGRRLSKTVNGTTTRFLYDGDQLIAETNASGAIIATYVYSAGIEWEHMDGVLYLDNIWFEPAASNRPDWRPLTISPNDQTFS